MIDYKEQQENYIADLVNQILLLINLNKHISKREQNCLINNEEIDVGLKSFFNQRKDLTKEIYQTLLNINTDSPIFHSHISDMLNDDEKPAFNLQLNYHLRKLDMLLV